MNLGDTAIWNLISSEDKMKGGNFGHSALFPALVPRNVSVATESRHTALPELCGIPVKQFPCLGTQERWTRGKDLHKLHSVGVG